MMPFNPGNPSFAKHGAEAVNADIDPFSDWVYREPRQPQFSVRDLNDAALKRLLGRFDRLIAGPLPRPGRRLDQAQLAVSPQPGYGKSHLIGRLFAALEGRATLIYVTPFHSPSLCWQSVLLRMVQELTFPDRRPENGLSPADEPPTQLDTFAHGVLAHLVAGLIESGKVHHGDPSGVAAWLRENPMDAFMLSNPEHPWAQWMREVFELFHRDMEGALRRANLSMYSPGWLRVLFRYAASLPGEEVRSLCLAWMSGQPLEPAEAALIGLRPGELTPADTPDQINEMCWRRMLDFCQLAAFYRPFVFCFDQTEAYGHSPALARCFGMVISQIHLMAANVMMVVTANQQPWEETVACHMETADKDRFAPLPLEGIRRLQAEELVRRRCQQHDVPSAQVEAFLESGWLTGRFPTERNRMGIRQFLQACSVRWQKHEEWWQHGIQGTPDLPFGHAIHAPLAATSPRPPASLPLQSSPLADLQPVPLRLIPRIGNPPPAGEEASLDVAVPPSVRGMTPGPVPTLVVVPKPVPEAAPTAVPSLVELHDRYTEDLATRPKHLLYHPDTFRWLVSEVAQGYDGLTVETQPDGSHSYLPVVWNLASANGQHGPDQVFFGFESGDNWRRWRSILREVQDRCLPPPLSSAAGQPVALSKAVFLRTPEQAPIPAAGWEIAGELDAAKRSCFDVIELEQSSVAEIYAARSLYLDAAAGDLPYSTGKVLEFLRGELGPFWERIRESMPGEPELVLSDATAGAN